MDKIPFYFLACEDGLIRKEFGHLKRSTSMHNIYNNYLFDQPLRFTSTVSCRLIADTSIFSRLSSVDRLVSNGTMHIEFGLWK